MFIYMKQKPYTLYPIQRRRFITHPENWKKYNHPRSSKMIETPEYPTYTRSLSNDETIDFFKAAKSAHNGFLTNNTTHLDADYDTIDTDCNTIDTVDITDKTFMDDVETLVMKSEEHSHYNESSESVIAIKPSNISKNKKISTTRVSRQDIMFDVEKASKRDNPPLKEKVGKLETICDNPEDIKAFMDSLSQQMTYYESQHKDGY